MLEGRTVQIFEICSKSGDRARFVIFLAPAEAGIAYFSALIAFYSVRFVFYPGPACVLAVSARSRDFSGAIWLWNTDSAARTQRPLPGL